MLLATNITALTLGEITGAFIIVSAVLSALFTLCIKVYGTFMKAHQAKSKSEDFINTVEKHSEDIQNINDKIDKLVDTIAKQEVQNKEVDCALLRDRIIQSYQHHKRNGLMNALDYENLNEMFIQYFNRGGNHLVSKIYKDFQTWEIHIDENE